MRAREYAFIVVLSVTGAMVAAGQIAAHAMIPGASPKAGTFAEAGVSAGWSGSLDAGVSAEAGVSPDQPAWSRVVIPDTPAGDALATLLEAFNNRDMEFLSAYLGAYTPQEVELQLFDWTAGVELVDVLSSARLKIRYVVKDNGSENRRIGTLEVAESKWFRVKDSQLRDLREEAK